MTDIESVECALKLPTQDRRQHGRQVAADDSSCPAAVASYRVHRVRPCAPAPYVGEGAAEQWLACLHSMRGSTAALRDKCERELAAARSQAPSAACVGVTAAAIAASPLTYDTMAVRRAAAADSSLDSPAAVLRAWAHAWELAGQVPF